MQKLGISYTKAINKGFNRVGALFHLYLRYWRRQGQFCAKPIQNYSHLLNLCVYIHANPVKDGLVDAPEDWEYSNYPEWLGLREGTLVNRGFVNENFGTAEEYQAFVQDYIHTKDLPDKLTKYLQELED